MVRGFSVVLENTRPDIESTAVLTRLDEALGLIERYQPWRLTHLRRDLARFWVVRYPCRGAYFPDTRTCMTELTFLARTDITAPVDGIVIICGPCTPASTPWVCTPRRAIRAREGPLPRRRSWTSDARFHPSSGSGPDRARRSGIRIV